MQHITRDFGTIPTGGPAQGFEGDMRFGRDLAAKINQRYGHHNPLKMPGQSGQAKNKKTPTKKIGEAYMPALSPLTRGEQTIRACQPVRIKKPAHAGEQRGPEKAG